MKDKTIVIGNNYVGWAFSGTYDVWHEDILLFSDQTEWCNKLSEVRNIIYTLDDRTNDIRINWDYNCGFLFDLFNFGKKFNIKIILLSTADLYGNNWEWETQTVEDSKYLDMNNDYRISKRVAERFLQNSDALIIRYKNPFDNRVNPNNAIIQCLKDGVLSGWQDSFTYLPDLVNSIKYLIDNSESGTYNIVQPQSASPVYLLKNVLRLPKFKDLKVEVDTLINPLINTDLDNDIVRADVNSTKIQTHVMLIPLDAAISLSWLGMCNEVDKALWDATIQS